MRMLVRLAATPVRVLTALLMLLTTLPSTDGQRLAEGANTSQPAPSETGTALGTAAGPGVRGVLSARTPGMGADSVEPYGPRRFDDGMALICDGSVCSVGGRTVSAGVAAGEPRILMGNIAGADYAILVPGQWNGTLLVFSHGFRLFGEVNRPELSLDNSVAVWLFDRGYALAGSAFRTGGWAVGEPMLDQIALLDHFEQEVGPPSRVIAWGYSSGALIAAGMAQAYPDRISAAAPFCGIMGGSISAWNSGLDALYVLKSLVAPASPLQLVRITDPAAAYQELQRILVLAQGTPQGRARIALAAAMGAIPGWFGPPRTTEPAADDLTGQEWHQFVYLHQITGYLLTFSRYQVEQQAGGNPSWNTGVDYDDLLARSPAAVQVQALYQQAGLTVEQDLLTLRNTPRIAPDLEAVSYLAYNMIFNGEIGVPVLTLHNASDGLMSVEHEEAYARVVQSAGNGELLRQLYVRRGGHCMLTAAEVIVALQVLFRRLDTGSWENLDPAALRAAAAALGPDLNRGPAIGSADPAFIPFTPPPLLRPFDARSLP